MRSGAIPLGALSALLLLLLPAVTAQPPMGALNAADLNARPLNVLQYHPYPDPEQDPWGFPGGQRNGTDVGYMEAAYGAYWYPTAVIDGVERVEGATEFLSTYNAYEALLMKRRDSDAPVRLLLNGVPTDASLTLDVEARAKRTLLAQALELRVVVFEDEVSFDGGNGVKVHRFVARAIALEQPFSFNGTDSVRFHAEVALHKDWKASHLGFVVSIHNRDTASPEFAPREVLQSATWRAAQIGPTVQSSRGVLLETLTATWCAACVYGDGAVDELANAYGVPSTRFLHAGWTYWRPIPFERIGAALAVAALAGVTAWIRIRRSETQP